jgi:hypothetical protein
MGSARCPAFAGVTTRRNYIAVLALALAAATASCGGSSPTQPSTPSADFASQFDSLWTTFDREYSYFEHKHIDWNALRTEFRPQALAAADQAGFIGVVREMLGRLHDLHVVIRDPGGATIPTYQPGHFVNWDRNVWRQYIARAAWTPGQGDSGHGTLDGVAYLVIGSWNGATVNVPAIDAALEQFRDAPALIVDVRMNGGGDDQRAFEVAGRFTTQSRTVEYVKVRQGGSFGPLTPRTISPRGAWQFTRPVLLLIGHRCASSNESFIAAMRELPHVTLAGDTTAGSSGNPGTFPLAGGWSYTVSRWIAYTADMQIIEDVGIAPREVVAASASDFAAGRDPVLDWALVRAAEIGAAR